MSQEHPSFRTATGFFLGAQVSQSSLSNRRRTVLETLASVLGETNSVATKSTLSQQKRRPDPKVSRDSFIEMTLVSRLAELEP